MMTLKINRTNIMEAQKYEQSKIHPRYLYLVLAGIVDEDDMADGIDIVAARKRHADYIRSEGGMPMDDLVSCYHFMTREFSDVTGEEAERYLLDDYLEVATSIPRHEPPSPEQQAALLQENYTKHDDLALGAQLNARLYTSSGHETYTHWRDVFTCLNMAHPDWLCADLAEDYIEF